MMQRRFARMHDDDLFDDEETARTTSGIPASG